MFAARTALKTLKQKTVLLTKRNAGGYLKKNLYFEENAGVRENTYKTWKFTIENSTSLFLGLFLPGVLLYYSAQTEFKIRDKHMNTSHEYGILPK